MVISGGMTTLAFGLVICLLLREVSQYRGENSDIGMLFSISVQPKYTHRITPESDML